MAKIVTITLYPVQELSEKARAKARDWYREVGFDYDWFDPVFDDFRAICEILGVDLKQSPVHIVGGSTRKQPCIHFTGFWRQGDGACFQGQYAYAHGAHVRIRAWAPRDAELHNIADRLRDIQRRYFYALRADIGHPGRYYHEYSMQISVQRDDPNHPDIPEDAETAIVDALRDLARWLYRALQSEYEALSSDEAVDDAIAANDYYFTADGRRFAAV